MFQTLLYACSTKSPQGHHFRCNKNIVCKISHASYILDIKFVTISHVCMNIRLNNNAYVHTNNSRHHHHSFSIYAITNKITITQHICIHRQYHNQLTYMYSRTISQSINIDVFTNNITSLYTNIIPSLTVHVKEKILHTKINIIFNTYQSFTYLHIII